MIQGGVGTCSQQGSQDWENSQTSLMNSTKGMKDKSDFSKLLRFYSFFFFLICVLKCSFLKANSTTVMALM